MRTPILVALLALTGCAGEPAETAVPMFSWREYQEYIGVQSGLILVGMNSIGDTMKRAGQDPSLMEDAAWRAEVQGIATVFRTAATEIESQESITMEQRVPADKLVVDLRAGANAIDAVLASGLDDPEFSQIAATATQAIQQIGDQVVLIQEHTAMMIEAGGLSDPDAIDGAGDPADPTLSRAVSRDTLGSAWPFTVDSGTVECRGASEVVFTTGGTTYAVNGMARQNGSYAEIDAIWAGDPSIPGAKIDISPIIEAGLGLCE